MLANIELLRVVLLIRCMYIESWKKSKGYNISIPYSFLIKELKSPVFGGFGKIV